MTSSPRRTICMILGASLVLSAGAVDYQWTAGSGLWSAPGNWTPSGSPGAPGDNASVNNGGSVEIDANVGSAGAALSTVQAGTGGSGTGDIFQFDGEVHAASVNLGRGAGRTGTYTLAGGGLNLQRLFVGGDGGAGAGWYWQVDGALRVSTNDLNVASGAGSLGTLVMRGGTIDAYRTHVGRDGGAGTLQHDGGTFNAGSSWVGTTAASQGSVELTGGTFVAGELRVGGSGGAGSVVNHGATVRATYTEVGWISSGRIEQTAGTFTSVGQSLILGVAGGSGTIDLSGGRFTVDAELRVGFRANNSPGHGTLLHSGGTLSAASTWIGRDADARGHAVYTGTAAHNTGALRVGSNGGHGVMDAQGGTVTTTSADIGSGPNGDGRLLIQGGTFTVGGDNTLNVANNANQPGASAGTLELLSGTLVATGTTNVGQNSGTNGFAVARVEVAGGQADFENLNVGNSAAAGGTFHHSGGRVDVSANGNGWMAVATQVGAAGTWISSGGVLDAHHRIELGPRTNSNARLVIQETADVRAQNLLFNTIHPGRATQSRLDLEGGTLRVDAITIMNTATNLHWGGGTLAPYTTSGTEGTADVSLAANPAGPFVSHGRTLTVGDNNFAEGAPDLRTGSGENSGGTDFTNASVLDLGGLYALAGTRHNRLLIQNGGGLDLTAPDDTLRLRGSSTLLRPTQGADWGTLTLVLLTGGGAIIGTFDTFLGPEDDGLGFAPAAAPVSDPSLLAPDTYALEYQSDRILLHYHVTVPDPALEPIGHEPNAWTYRLAPGRTAWLESASSLTAPDWIRLAVPPAALGQIMRWDIQSLSGTNAVRRYYRVGSEPGP